MKVKLSELQDISKKAILKYGYTETEADIVLEMLMYAQLRGNNQGIVKLIGKGIPKHEDVQEPTIEKETETTALINCNLTMEAICMDLAVKMVVEKAKKMNIAVVGTHNGAGSSGAIGHWSRKVADEGLIAITMSSYPFDSVPPYGSYEPLYSTNPIAWGIPAADEPIVLDMSSSAISFFGLVEAKTKGVQVSENIGWDKDGNETTDPAEIMDGAIKPFDRGFKGAGLALMVQIIGGALVGADFHNGSDNDGNIIIAINPNGLAGTDYLISEVTKIKNTIKNAKRLPGVDEVMVPGERGDKIRAEILETGEVEVEDNLLAELKKFIGE